jgi:D-alanyl-D-alanine carboxypeptidase (penicillin-binding protein 5/6)
LIAPIEAGEVIGTAQLVYEGEPIQPGYLFDAEPFTVDVVAEGAVEKANWFMLTVGAVGDFFTGIFSTSVDWIKGLFS